VAKRFTADFDLLVLENGLNGKAGSGSPLTPGAMTNGYSQRVTLRGVSHGSA
jgi:hypothetical protein